MKKNRYNFPAKATNSNNPLYNQYVEDMFFADSYNTDTDKTAAERHPRWKNNGRTDLYHDPMDSSDYYRDPVSVAQHYIDRTRRPHG